MSTSQTLGTVTAETSVNPNGACKACQRKGLPILPLRRALTPAIGDTKAVDSLSGVAYHDDGLRSLRQGYLYVLLDKKVWQAYAVTPEGALRQFDPYEMPRADPVPLSTACVKENHDVPSSFLNINTGKYRQAQVAFANDPWPASVLDAYKQGKAPASRFTTYDLAALKANPASVANAMAFTQADDLRAKVWEYAPSAKDFRSVHGFYPRATRLDAMQAFANIAARQHDLKHGVPVLLLPDPIGVVQECNALRARWVTVRQTSMASDDRPFKLFTSQALLGIKELEAKWAAAEAKAEAQANADATEQFNRSPMGEKAARWPVDVPAETARLTQDKIQDQHGRLAERYNEALRKQFQDSYDKDLANYQTHIDTAGAKYEKHFWADPFQIAAQYDYASTDARKPALGPDAMSALACTRMLSQCLAGGPTEALPVNDKAELGPTQKLWKKLLEDPKSLLFQGLLAKDQALLELIGQDLGGDSKGKLYDTIKTLIGSTQGQKAMAEPVQQAVGQLLAASASAGNALAKQLAPTMLDRIGHLHSASFLRYSGQWITETIVDISVGDYLTQLSDALHDRADELLARLHSTVSKPAVRQVRAMVMSGALTVATAKNNTLTVKATVWVLDKAEGVKARVQALGQNVQAGATQGKRFISIGTATLEKDAAKVMQAVALGAVEARQFVGEAMHGLRRAGLAGKRLGGSAPDLLLSLGSLWFQQDSLRKSIDAVAKVPGAGHDEAVAAAWSSSIGVMGVGVEFTGLTMKALYPEITTAVKAADGVKLIATGARVAQFGGAISAVSGVVDGVGYAWAAQRVGAQGDAGAEKLYEFAAAVSIGSAVAGVFGAMALEATLLGPLGIALVLGMIAYGIAQWAKSKESTPLELWARHTLWGLPTNQQLWKNSHDHDTAIAALNAAVLGLTAEAGIHICPRSDGGSRTVGASVSVGENVSYGFNLQYAIALPGYDMQASRYQWSLTVTRYNGNQVIAGGSHNGSNASAVQAPPKHADYAIGTAFPTIAQEGQNLSIRGDIELSENHDISAYTLEVTYWPDKSDEDGWGKLTVVENQLDKQATQKKAG